MVMKTIHEIGKNINVVRTQNGKREIYEIFSYNTLVAEYVKNCGMGFDGLIRLYSDWDCSNTTKKHVNKCLLMFGGFTTSTSDLKYGIENGYLKSDNAIAVKLDIS